MGDIYLNQKDLDTITLGLEKLKGTCSTEEENAECKRVIDKIYDSHDDQMNKRRERYKNRGY